MHGSVLHEKFWIIFLGTSFIKVCVSRVGSEKADEEEQKQQTSHHTMIGRFFLFAIKIGGRTEILVDFMKNP